MKKMKVSLVIPIYNVEQYIENCLLSIEQQTFADFEVILVDDCGTDISLAIVNDFIRKSPIGGKMKVLHHEHNRGLSAARNTGTSVASGEYVYYLDSDDTITPDCLETLVHVAEETKANMVVGNINVIGDASFIPQLSCIEGKNLYLIESDNFHQYLSGIYYMMAWNKLVRKSFLDENKISFVEGLIHEDCAWSFSVACRVSSVAIINRKTYNYLVRSNSIQTDTNFERHFNAFCQLLPYYNSEARKAGYDGDELFISWYERQKAMCFGDTLNKGTCVQQKKIYNIIRSNLPQAKWTKFRCHYYFPSFVGIHIYRKFFGYKLM